MKVNFTYLHVVFLGQNPHEESSMKSLFMPGHKMSA